MLHDEYKNPKRLQGLDSLFDQATIRKSNFLYILEYLQINLNS
jgi:hypothetical protein